MSKEALIELLNNVDEQEFDVLYRIILKFVKEVPPYADEVEAIQRGEMEYRKGEVYSHNEVWS